MSGGFPLRPDRAAFGPTPVNRFPVRDPERELDGPSIGDLIMWQLSGCGLTVPRATATIAVDGLDAATLADSAEAWDPKALVVPVLTHPGVGEFLLTYAATYPDRGGTAQSTNLTRAIAVVQSLNTWIGFAAVQAGGLLVDVNVRTLAGVLDDPTSTNVFVLAW